MSRRRKGSGHPGRTGRGRARERRTRDIFVPRPFEGLTDEPEWVALRELVPAATAPLELAPSVAEEYGSARVVLATLLPLAWPALRRPDGTVLVGVQRQTASGDINRDLAASILSALATEAGEGATPVDAPADPGPGPRLADVLVDGELEITLHEDFSFWTEEGDEADPMVTASLERANESVYPTVRMAAARAAYWCQVPGRAHLRWVLPDQEDDALAALSRLGAAGALKLGDDTRFAGMFRAHGLLVPVWDLPRETPAAEWEEPLAEFGKRYAEALAADGPLDAAARRARQGLIGRQLTLR